MLFRSMNGNSIAKVISKLPINNTNNVVVNTDALVKSDKQFLIALQTIGNSLNDSLTTMKLMFQEMCKKEKPVVVKPIEKDPLITGMKINHNDDGRISSVEFIR